MDSILETPAKRRRTSDGHVPCSQAYDSQNDSGDELFEGHETVATIPLPKPSSSSPAYITQPTQLINGNTQKLSTSPQKPSVVQVAASSPARVSNSVSSPPSAVVKSKGNTVMKAPAGTFFRPPIGIIKPPQVIDLSDDEGPFYRGGSSEDESQPSRADIQPTTFVKSTKDRSGLENAKKPVGGISRFREITAGAFYKPLQANQDSTQSVPAAKRSADVMANAYGGSNRPPKQNRQAKPAKAQVVDDISIDDIGDYSLRRKIERMRAIFSQHTVRQCKDALFAKRGVVDDALEWLMSRDPHPLEIDLTSDNDQTTNQASSSALKASVKKQVKPAIKSIQERWTGSQYLGKSGHRPVSASSSSRVVSPPKPRRRLVQGKNRASIPADVPDALAEAPSPGSKRRETPDSDESDSGLDLEEDDRAEIEIKVLDFFNKCSSQDLADIASITEDVAILVVSRKPFKSLNDVRRVTREAPKVGSTKQTAKKPIGDKIVDKCLDMWKGYEAVDELVKRCETLGKPVAEDMKKWGVDVFGASVNGELEVVSIDEHTSPGRDSGIGTPSCISADENDEIRMKKPSSPRNRRAFFPQPALLGDGIVLKDYQVVGINWLSLLFNKKLSCILADDMGLGKTCQVVSFLAHLKEKAVKGVHLIVVPASTLENWLREFQVFCPQLQVMPYYADQKERELVREEIETRIQDRTVDVIVTTYGMAKRKQETKFLRRLHPVVCVYDEGHLLKNSRSEAYTQLMRIGSQFRLLLTGTPLQNNLSELVSLLGFILPSVFQEHSENLQYIFSHKAKTTDDSHAALLSVQRIARAKAMMTPFVLRRKKHQVLKHLPTKTRRVEYCELTPSQSDIYESQKQKALKIVRDRAAGVKVNNESSNIMMALRKASIHPLLFRRLYTDSKLKKMSKACLSEPEFADSNLAFVYEDMEIMTDWELHNFCERYPDTMSSYKLDPDACLDSGKITALTSLLKDYIANGDRVLIFSQFVMVLNLLEPLLDNLNMAFSRLDGDTAISTRQPLIDDFTTSDPPIPVFLLSTKAGGAGINLACANRVVIFDSSFNPQDDIQAENRAHRVGQIREVEVVRLVSKGTVEEQILALGETKVALDEKVAGVGTEGDEKKAEAVGQKKVEEMMWQSIKEQEETDGEKKDKKKDKKKT